MEQSHIKLVPSSVVTPGWSGFVIFCLVPCVAGFIFFLVLKNRSTWLARWPAWLRVLTLNLLAMSFFCTLGFLLIESYYRFIYDTTDSFNYTLVSKRWFGRYFKYNSSELRDNIEYPEDIPRGARRVTFIGDSFTVGQGVKNVDDRFANRIRKLHPDWDVQVLAVEGLDTGGEIDATDRLVKHHYQMDLVVLVYCLNDISDMMPEWLESMNKIYQGERTRNWLQRNSYFADAYSFRLRARFDTSVRNYFGYVHDGYAGPYWPKQKDRLAVLQKLVESGGGHLVVVTFPFLHALGPGYEYQFAHDELGQFWRDQKVPHLDLLPVFKDHPSSSLVVNRLDAHPNEFAHALATDAIDKFLQDQLKAVPPPKQP